MHIVLHLGAHKTATTYIQKCLAQSDRRLTRYRVRFMGPKQLRPRLQAAIRRGRGSTYAARRDALAWIIDEAEERGCRRLILSDEMFSGSLRDIVAGKDLYRDSATQLAPLMGALGGRPVKIALALRNYADFLVSAYGQALRGWRYMPFDAALRERLLNLDRGWHDLIDDMASGMPPGSAITHWRYEDFNAVEDQVFALLAGPAGRDVRRLASRPFPGPSQAAIDFLDEIAARGITPDKGTVHAALDEASKDKGYPAYNPWTAEERDYLTARYRQDLIWIGTRLSCSRISPPTTSAPRSIAALAGPTNR